MPLSDHQLSGITLDHYFVSNLSTPISDFAVQFLDFDGCSYDKESITQEVLDKMIQFIRAVPVPGSAQGQKETEEKHETDGV